MKGQYETFVIRIMREDKSKFKGNIQHVSTQEHAHFDTYEGMNKFIQNRLKPAANGTLTSENNVHVSD
jgi:hypothetical protein